MAITNVDKIQLRLQFDDGKVNDRQKYKLKTMSNISQTATDESLIAVSDAINSVTAREVLKTQKIVTTDIR